MPTACLISLPLPTTFSAPAPEAEERTGFVFLSCPLLWWGFLQEPVFSVSVVCSGAGNLGGMREALSQDNR